MADDPGHPARRLLRAARAGTLATQSHGQPFASLVTPATTVEADVLLLLSSLSAHTRHLAADPRCALLVTGQPDGPNPQTAPRLTVSGRAAPDPDPTHRARWLARHPYAADYAGFSDFALWRLSIEGGHYIGGFASAHTFDAAALRPLPAASSAIGAAASDILTDGNAVPAGTLGRIARACGAGTEIDIGAWRMAAVDPDGMDLAAGDAVVRVSFAHAAADAAGVRAALTLLIASAADGFEGGAKPARSGD